MIFGEFTASSDKKGTSLFNDLQGIFKGEDITVNLVQTQDFSGGFCLHSRLPYTGGDMYHNDPGRDILVLMSGCIYNKPELYPFFNIQPETPDPAFIAAVFLREGPGFAEKLNGDFTIFILQPEKKQAYLFRDHLGIRPMAYTILGDRICFSSDIMGLCRTCPGKEIMDGNFLMTYFKSIDLRTTPNQRVTKLLPGHYLRFSESGIELVRYWDPGKIKVDRELSYGRMLSELKSLLWDAVQIRCDQRFVAGAHMSGGIDSGVISALVRSSYPRQRTFHGFSWSSANFTPNNIPYDERELIKKLCSMAGVQPVFSSMNIADFQRIVLYYYHNQCYFFEHKTEEQAQSLGTNLIFSGWGGDDFISIDHTGIDSDLLFGLNLRRFFHRNPVIPFRKFLRNVLSYVIFPAVGLLRPGVARSFKIYARYLKGPFKRSERSVLKDFYFYRSRHGLHLGLLRFYHLQERCESEIINGFRHGVEYRYPMLDKRIIEYMLRVPSVILAQSDHNRPVLREVSEGLLPEEFRWHWQKADPVQFAHTEYLFKESAIVFMNEVGDWKANPDLGFVDFDLLEKDIREFNRNPERDHKTLFIAVVYLKAIHEFTRTYHG
ncbi:MAG TPA: asparagine synthase-related protein [Bacteroidales bacterium]|nr:asparagine synthase-related protein [Bacteroidales bacterium]HRZ20227.1 asparagine synthase-related protein [Bacteroidales bacterium]